MVAFSVSGAAGRLYTKFWQLPVKEVSIRDIFYLRELAVTLEKSAKIIGYRCIWKVASDRLSASSDHDVIRDVPPILGPFVEKVQNVIHTADLANVIFTVREDRALKQSA